MLIKFESEHSGNFVMLSDVAVPLLKMMGMSGNTEGAVSEDNLAEALSTLENSLQKAQHSASDPDDEDDEDDAPIGLSTRASPLLDMLRKARQEGGYVMWRPE
ncbi:MAG: DUF1840 domain-containing protein [Gammaproteobacteria bacterium]|nr:DUF1840 domain-containing protein [Gammaproteobacteria bacterium]MDP2141494.1 DUF1840 domain-containing protein [Gammaproteobacteria bacterium]MDP2347481.1 DUF1840 domain-containing protein [Gammaproteobacteria bacterium]